LVAPTVTQRKMRTLDLPPHDERQTKKGRKVRSHSFVRTTLPTFYSGEPQTAKGLYSPIFYASRSHDEELTLHTLLLGGTSKIGSTFSAAIKRNECAERQ